MGKQIRKGQNITTRHTFPISELMSDDSIFRLGMTQNALTAQQNRNAAAIRRVHHN